MTVQLSYTKNTANALAGLVADVGPYEIDSFTNETGVIPFGAAVSQGTNDTEAVIGGGAAFLGIATRMTAKENTIVGAEQEQYNENETMAVMRRGKVWVTLAAGGSPGDLVVYTDATGVIDVGVPGAGVQRIGTLETSTGAGELGLLRLEY